jgi:KaiC/GvpD/RAD55 family RecA-like ATPase
MSALESALQLVTDVEDIDGGIPSIEELVALAAPVLRRRALTRAIRDAVTDHGKGKSLLARAREIEAAERIGHETSVGSTALTNSVWTAIEDLRRVDRLKTGIDALDQALGGGFTARSLVTLAAATNVGKTAMLVHVACYAWLCGRRVIFLPTEEGVSNTLTRIVSWISGIPIDRVALSDPLAKQRFADRLAQYNSGSLFVEYLPQGSTVGQLRRLVTKIQDDHEALRDGYDVLIVDYADKMDAPGEKAYDKMKVVYEGLRQLAVDHNNWTITASQVKQIQDKDRVRPDVNDLSDSSWKGRTSDAVITIYRDPNDIHARSFYVAKNRGPGVGAEIGPVPSQLERARIVPLLAGLFDEDDDP